MKLYKNLIVKFTKKNRIIKIDSEEDSLKVTKTKPILDLISKSKVRFAKYTITKNSQSKEINETVKFESEATQKEEHIEEEPKINNQEEDIYETDLDKLNDSSQVSPCESKHKHNKQKTLSEVKLNLNINIQEINNNHTNIYYITQPPSFKSDDTETILISNRDAETPCISPRKENKTIDSNPKSPSKWRKLSNVFSAIKGFNRYDTKNLGNETDIDQDLKDYKSRLHDNTLKSRFIEYIQPEERELSNMTKEEYEEDLRRNILNEIYE
jgi:hypothetical protein